MPGFSAKWLPSEGFYWLREGAEPVRRNHQELVGQDSGGITNQSSHYTLLPIPAPFLSAAQQNDSSIVFLRAFATKFLNGFHEPGDAAIMRGHESCEAHTAEFLVLAVQRFGNPVGVEQQAEITAELHGVLGKLTGKQAERHPGVGVERAHIGSMAEQGPGVTCAGEGEGAARRV